jgi:Tfp pilus assembly protein PilO
VRQTSADEIQLMQSNYESLELLAQEISQSDAAKGEFLKLVPVGTSQDELILDLEKIADSLDFDLNAMNFNMSVDQVRGNTINVAANFSGTYNDLIAFLEKIETADRLMRVTSMNVQLSNSSDIVFNLNIEAYYQ